MAKEKRDPTLYPGNGEFDDVRYLEAKLILRGSRFTSVDDFRAFEKIVRRAARDTDVGYVPAKARSTRLREVLFLDTQDFRLYNNAFILRRRMDYEDGFLTGDPEIVFKFRHPHLPTAAAIDMTPQIDGNHVIKFKAEALPLKERAGGVRLLYSHNCQFGISQIGSLRDLTGANLVRILPPLAPLFPDPAETVHLVNRTAVVEVLLDLGTLDFGKGVTAPANVAVWRSRGDERQLVGEFSFQAKFKRASDLQQDQRQKVRRFYLHLQTLASDWLALGVTKTGSVYRLSGNPPQSHE